MSRHLRFDLTVTYSDGQQFAGAFTIPEPKWTIEDGVRAEREFLLQAKHKYRALLMSAVEAGK